jgi:hypothetical protein
LTHLVGLVAKNEQKRINDVGFSGTVGTNNYAKKERKHISLFACRLFVLLMYLLALKDYPFNFSFMIY